MNYAELQQAVIADTHRADLAGFVPRFITECEGLIRRQLKGYPLSASFGDSFRVAEGLYNLPARALMIRRLAVQGRQGDSLQRVSPGAIRRLDTTADVLQYAEYGDGTVEFRGTPGADVNFDMLYFGSPQPLAADGDTNELLTDHESLYIAGAKFFLYVHTQDRELAQDELDIFNGVVETLDEQIARMIGGADNAPAYNFSGGSAY